MPRRVNLPTADDLFRPTVVPDPVEQSPVVVSTASTHGASEPPEPTAEEAEDAKRRTGSGRVRHDEKMTVYITSDELLDIEQARLALRRGQGMAVDRGRLVRAAVAIALADFEAHGDESVLVRRLSDPAGD